MENLTPVFILLAGIVLGGVAIWFVRSSQVKGAYDKAQSQTGAEKATLTERLNAREATVAQLDGSLKEAQSAIAQLEDDLRTETARLSEQLRTESAARASEREKAAAGALRVTQLDASLVEREKASQALQSEISNLRAQLSELDTRLSEERKATQEKLALLTTARNELTEQFQNLANVILEEKSKKFTEQNEVNVKALLAPLGDKIGEFQKRIENTHLEDTKQRSFLLAELESLKNLNTQISDDANNLTKALKGDTKKQGDWGEVILERVLEVSGLVKGREYDLQLNLIAEDGTRSRPDAVIRLPEDRHVVIDAKVNLTAYERFHSLAEGDDRERALKQHIAAFREHVNSLSIRRYQDHYKLNSLDFVLMFVPIEPAFNIVVGSDNSLYDDAFGRKIIIVTPTTLHATLHTIRSIWRHEYQNRNVQEIAKQASALYDKFVGFVSDLEDIGTKLRVAQGSYDDAHNKLTSGKGNLIGRTERIKKLGLKTKKDLDKRLLETTFDESSENGDLGEGDPEADEEVSSGD